MISKQNIFIDEEIVSIAVYGDFEDLNIRGTIKGISVFKNSKDGIIHKLYKIDNSNPKLLIQKNIRNCVFIQSIGYYSYLSGGNSAIFFQRSSATNSNRIIPNNDFDKALLEQYPIIFTYKLASSHYCTASVCNSTAKGFCAAYENGQVYCGRSSYIDDDPICGKDENENLQQEEEHLAPTPKQSTARTAMYSIRDNILSLSTKGSEYVDFYYKLSYVFKVHDVYYTDRAEIKQLMDFLDDKSILFLTASDSTVIISKTDQIYLDSLITKYKTLTTNVEYQNILTTLKNDLDLLTDKTKADVLDYILL